MIEQNILEINNLFRVAKEFQSTYSNSGVFELQHIKEFIDLCLKNSTIFNHYKDNISLSDEDVNFTAVRILQYQVSNDEEGNEKIKLSYPIPLELMCPGFVNILDQNREQIITEVENKLRENKKFAQRPLRERLSKSDSKFIRTSTRLSVQPSSTPFPSTSSQAMASDNPNDRSAN